MKKQIKKKPIEKKPVKKKPVEKKRMGRPTNFKKEYCDLLEAHLASGLSFKSFAGTINTTEDSLHQWKNKHEDFALSKKKGIAKCSLFWERLGRSGVAGKINGFNTGAWIFNMKNRFGWRDKHEVEHIGDTGRIHIIVEKDEEDL